MQAYINNFNFFKIIFFITIYSNLEKKYNAEVFFREYFFKKYFWYLFLNFYNFYYKSLRINIKKFFNFYILKILCKTLIISNLKKKHIFSELDFLKMNLQDIFMNKKYKKLIKSKKKVLINFCIKKNLKYLLNNYIKIKIPFFFFNKQKKNLFRFLVLFLTKCFKLYINRSEYVDYWTRFYKYTLKRIYIYYVYIIKKLFFFFFIIFKSFIKILNWKKTVNKLELLYFFFFNNKKKIFFNNFKLYSIYDNMYKLLNLNFYKKKNYNIYIFSLKKKHVFSKKNKKEFFIFTKFIKFKINEFSRLVFFILFLKSISIWMNAFVCLYNINNHNEYFFLQLKKSFFFSDIHTKKTKRKVHFLVFKKNYYIYDGFKKN